MSDLSVLDLSRAGADLQFAEALIALDRGYEQVAGSVEHVIRWILDDVAQCTQTARTRIADRRRAPAERRGAGPDRCARESGPVGLLPRAPKRPNRPGQAGL